MRVKYKNPPINELVLGIYFTQPVVKFRSEHVGLYWSKIKSDFPKSFQNVPIGNVDIPTPNEVFPMPRYWFISNDNVHVIQVQRNAFFFNWRREKDDYPHYDSIKQKFDDYFSMFEKFCMDELEVSEIDVERCELNYINIVYDTPYFASFLNTKDVIPSFNPLQFGSRKSVLKWFNLSYVYSCNNDSELTVTLQSRRHKMTDNDVLYFELKSSGALSLPTKSEADLWFRRAHDAIGDAFNGLTNPDVQRQYWQPRED